MISQANDGSPRSVDRFDIMQEMTTTRLRAQTGDAEAQWKFGCWCLEGSHGLKQSTREASSWLEKSAKAGHPEAQWQLTILADQDDVEALYWCQKAADQHHSLALGKLAQVHLQGNSIVKPSARMAFHYYSIAAKRGDADSQFQMGVMYERGIGCKKNYLEAARCYVRLAKKHQHADAMFHLGNLYMMGDGVAADLGRAFTLWEKAAELGHEEASNFIALRELALE